MIIKKFNEMFVKFQQEQDKNFYYPSVSGPEGKLPSAGTNTGGDNINKTYKNDAEKIQFFKDFSGGEYRKGSSKFGKIVSRIMEFLRLPEFKTKLEENDGLKFKIDDFEKRSHIKIDEIKQLLTTDNNLYSFDIDIKDGFIIFSNIKKTYKDRYVSGRKG